MSLSKESLSAFMDGELEPQEIARIAALVEQDPSLKSFVDEQDKLRAELRAAFSDVMTDAVPERLLAAAAHTPVSLRVRARKWFGSGSPALRFGVPAAAMALGLLIGVGVERTSSGVSDFGTSPSGQIVARADLADALEHKLAADAGRTQIGVTFRDKSGTTCRTFTTSAGTTNGLACRYNGEWQVGALVSGPKAQATGYALAGSEMPDAIRNAIAARISGEPFDAAAERAARDSGWK